MQVCALKSDWQSRRACRNGCGRRNRLRGGWCRDDVGAATIRRATVSDARDLAVVRVRGWQVGYAVTVHEGFLAAMSIDENEVRWRAIIDGQVERHQTLVAEVDDRVVGFASIGPYRSQSDHDKTLETTVGDEPGTVGELYGFHVRPDSCGTSVANELHEAALDVLQAAGWVTLKLWVLEGNARARRFHEPHSWTADGNVRNCRLLVDRCEVRYERALGTGTDREVQPSIESCSAAAAGPGRRDTRTGSCSTARSTVTSSRGSVVRSMR